MDMYKSVNFRDCPFPPKTTAYILVAVSLTLILVNQSISIYLIFKTNMLDMVILPFTRDYDNFLVGQILTMVLNIWQSGTWVLPIVMDFMITSTLNRRFIQLNNELEETVENTNTKKKIPGGTFRIYTLKMPPPHINKENTK